jgi:hypothetical protein
LNLESGNFLPLSAQRSTPIGKYPGAALNQVCGFARASGGNAQVDSIVGQGTTFTLLLRRSARDPQPSAAPAEMLFALHKQRILLVEDDDTVADTVGGMLADLGYETERSARAGFDLIESALRSGFFVFRDFLISDRFRSLGNRFSGS